MANEKNGNFITIGMWVIGSAITLLLFAFGSLEKRKCDKSVFDLHKENENQRFGRIEGSLDRIEVKIDQLNQKGNP